MPRKRKRTWGTGSVFPSGGRWAVRWRENGRRKSKSYATKDLAEQVLAKINHNIARGEAGLPDDHSDAPTLEELATAALMVAATPAGRTTSLPEIVVG